MGAGKVRKAFRWSVAGTLGNEVIGLVLLVALARLLTPEDYGIAAIAGAMLAIGRFLTEAGFDRALVQSLHIDANDETTVFYANIVLGILAGGLLAAAAPGIAAFYGEPRLALMLQVAALQPPILAIALLQIALLERELDFRARSRAEFGANLGAGAIALGLAFAGFGPWSLIAQFMAYACLRGVLAWIQRPWWPRGRFSRASLARLWGFSWRLALNQLFHTIFLQLHTLAIGRLFGMYDVGLFNRSQNLQTPFTSATASIFGKVSFSAFARMQQEPERLRESFRRILRVVSGTNAAMMCGIAAVAVPLVDVVLSPRWSAAAPLLQAFALVGFFRAITHQHAVVAVALGRTGVTLAMTVMHHALSLGLLAITWRYGLQAVVLGLSVRAFIHFVVWAFLARSLIGYRLRDQVADLLPQLLAGLLAGTVAQAVIHLLDAGALIELTCAVAAGAAAWLLPVLALRHSAFADVYQEASSLLRRKGRKDRDKQDSEREPAVDKPED